MDHKDKITDIIKELNEKTHEYLKFRSNHNKCIHTDKLTESIIELSKNLDFEYQKEFGFNHSLIETNIRNAAEIVAKTKTFTLTRKDIERIIEGYGSSITNWSINDYINAVTEQIKMKEWKT